jgi:hypothetical protein
MKEKALLIMVGTFSAGTVAALLMGILPVEQFVPLAVMVIGYAVQEMRLSNNDKAWGGWTEDAARQAEARYQALVAMSEKMMAQLQEAADKKPE